MRLKEITEPLPKDEMEEAFDLIYEYVTYGEVHDSAHIEHFDQSFQRLMEILPRPTSGLRVFRALRLTDQQTQELRSGRLDLPMRQFMSWTKDMEVAERIAWGKGRTGHPVIVEHTFDVSQIVVDVLAFYRVHKIRDESFFNYVRKEREVIIKHDASMTLTPANTHFLEREGIVPPQPGDVVFLPDEEDPYEIREVPEYQPEASAGVFHVMTIVFDRIDVRPIMVNGKQAEGEWEAVD